MWQRNLKEGGLFYRRSDKKNCRISLSTNKLMELWSQLHSRHQSILTNKMASQQCMTNTLKTLETWGVLLKKQVLLLCLLFLCFYSCFFSPAFERNTCFCCYRKDLEDNVIFLLFLLFLLREWRKWIKSWQHFLLSTLFFNQPLLFSPHPHVSIEIVIREISVESLRESERGEVRGKKSTIERKREREKKIKL